MKNMRLLLLVLFILIFTNIDAQKAPTNRLVNWKKAGHNGPIIYPATTINMVANGADSTGIIPCDALVQNFINNANASGVVLEFGSGTFLFNNTIALKSNIVLHGMGASKTILKFNLNGANDCITITGTYTGTPIKVKADMIRNSNGFNTDSFGLVPQAYYRLSFNDSSLMFSPWAYGTAGQIYKIETTTTGIPYGAVADADHRLNYAQTKNPMLQRIIPVEHAGIECLKIVRQDTTIGQTSNIAMRLAVNCWVKGIESENCNFAHVLLQESKNCQVSNSWMHHAFGYGGNGQAYGVVCQIAASDNLVVNNCFNALRHAMLLQAGANGNVYAYNYSTDPYWTEIIANSSGDIAMHGNYPYANLLEGNIVSHIWSDNSHGANGPLNTFLRNRSTGYGFSITSGDSLNIIGNEIVNYTPFYGNWNMGASVGHYMYGNNVVGSNNTSFAVLPGGTANVSDTSFIYTKKPNFLWAQSWPVIGLANAPKLNTNNALDRYISGEKAYCIEVPETINDIKTERIYMYPNPFVHQINFMQQNIKSVVLYNAQGLILKQMYGNNIQYIDNLEWLQQGIYFIKINDKQCYKVIK
jgi:Pectate lyase superfamily protein/Secretion system C-terminal sorting domain